jgi:hypothetical protein
VNLRDGTVVHSCWGRGAIIGDDVSIGHKALISRFATPFVDCRWYRQWQRGERLPPNVSADPP